VIRDAGAAAKFDAHFVHVWETAQPMDEFDLAIRRLSRNKRKAVECRSGPMTAARKVRTSWVRVAFETAEMRLMNSVEKDAVGQPREFVAY
jgi:hypothetical protein